MKRAITLRRLVLACCLSVGLYAVTMTVMNLHQCRQPTILSDKTIKKCLLPSIEPDPANFPPNVQTVTCPHNQAPVRVLEGGSLYISPLLNATCSYYTVNLVDDFHTETSQTSHEIPNNVTSMPCPSDVLQVKCVDETSKNTRFEAVLRCVGRKDSVTKRIKAKPKTTTVFKERLNILMFGLDSVARVTWLEQMQKTTKLMQELDAMTFEGYNIVGDGTTAAILGFTTGYFEEELHESRRGFAGARQVDDFPFIFKQLREEANYVTLFDEDGSGVATFNYRLLGFKEPPVDYYGRHFQMALERFGYPKDDCLGAMSTFEEMARLYRHLFAIYPDPVRKFAMVFNGHYTHTSAGAGAVDAHRIDAILAEEMRWLYDQGHFNQSVVILFADHGSRFGGSRATHQGKISERLPYLSIAFPPWFRAKYKEEMSNFEAATKQLTTPFDLHATLLDIGGVRAVPGLPPRGLSFFQPIPESRGCEEAGILPHWCVCLSREDNSVLSMKDPLVTRSLQEFERFVNEELLREQQNDCQRLKAVRPFSAQRLNLGSKVLQFVQTIDGHGRVPKFEQQQQRDMHDRTDYLQVSFWTQPGDGQWEVTFSYKTKVDKIQILPKQISRTNRYGSAPACIQDSFPHLRQFCYCKANTY